MRASDRLRIALAMREDELRDARHRLRLQAIALADLAAALRRAQEREALRAMEAQAGRLFDAAQTQGL